LKVLDVGCGNAPKGDVNLDLFFYGKWKNFIIAEAHHLPFKNSIFEKVYCKHCLEHFENPLKFFEEAKRVLKNGGTIECIYPTDAMLTKKTFTTYLTSNGHPLLNGRQSSPGAKKSAMEATNGNYPMTEFLNCLEKQASQKQVFTK